MYGGKRTDNEICARLLSEAEKAREKSYCRYSGFAVGAALMTMQGDIYVGCNIENSAYGPTVCAERTAMFKAVSEGERAFRCIAVVGALQGEPPVKACAPCGVCRQVMSEFCAPDFEIITADGADGYTVRSLAELLPEAFEL